MVPFRCEKVINEEDLYDDANYVYDYHKNEERYKAAISKEILARGLDPRKFSNSDIQKEIERRMRLRDVRKGTHKLKVIGSHYCQRIANKMAFYI